VKDLPNEVALARGGDLAAYERIVVGFQDMACGYAYALLGDFHLAQDAAQEAFVEAYQCLGALREPAAFAGWFRRIVLKHCDRMTRGKRMTTTSLDRVADVAGHAPDPARAAEQRELANRVLEAIGSLAEHQRMATSLFYIDGYSQQQVAEFLEVPVSTIKSRLRAAQSQLKDRMINMVETSLKNSAPDHRFSKRVIDSLLARPRPLEIEDHPVHRIWIDVRAALSQYTVIAGDEIEEIGLAQSCCPNPYGAPYELNERQALRTQTTTTLWQAMSGRLPPVRLMTAGRVFRRDVEDTMHSQVFHQVDAVQVAEDVDLEALRTTLFDLCGRVVGEAPIRFGEDEFHFVDHPLSVEIKWNNTWCGIAGAGMLKPQTLDKAGYDPQIVSGFAFGFGLDRMAMIKFGIDDIRKLWLPPYVAASR
jgi:RNA polymerase sigma factor (sigma-70 family)